MVKGEWLLRTGTALPQRARACLEQERTRQLPIGSPGKQFDRDVLVSPLPHAWSWGWWRASVGLNCHSIRPALAPGPLPQLVCLSGATL